MFETDRAARWTTGVLLSLIALVLAWQLSEHISIARVALATTFTIPLWLPLRGVLRGDRRTYAWATLCVIPYFILGVTEAIADPGQRAWAAACLGLALVLFGSLVGYLRLTR